MTAPQPFTSLPVWRQSWIVLECCLELCGLPDDMFPELDREKMVPMDVFRHLSLIYIRQKTESGELPADIDFTDREASGPTVSAHLHQHSQVGRPMFDAVMILLISASGKQLQ